MGCFQARPAVRNISTRSSSAVVLSNALDLTSQEKQHLNDIWALLQAQGTDTDVGHIMFKRFFEQFPSAKSLFANAGMFGEAEVADLMTDGRFRALQREVVASLSASVDLLDDEELLVKYLREVREVHERVTGLEAEHFQVMARCIEYAVKNTLSSALSRAEKESVRKFAVFVAGNITPRPEQERSTVESLTTAVIT